ncbi:MAG: hypothetical protein KDA79_18570, partial [Planctomycetaceae bacterium]|nr:hypothetical protein [Planctomycetaceae bacterium]
MPRRSPSRLDKRREAEALEALEQNGSTAAPKRKKAAAKKKAVKKTATRARRTRKEATVRNRMVWAVFSGSMKEEA